MELNTHPASHFFSLLHINHLQTMSFAASSLNTKLSKPTSFFGLKLWLVIVICIVILILFILLFLSLCIICHRRRKPHNAHACLAKPIVSKDVLSTFSTSSMDRRLLSRNNFSEIEMNAGKHEHQVVISDQWSSKGSGTSTLRSIASDLNSLSNVRLGNMFTLREIEDATNGLADDNVIGNGDYGVVYRGVFWDYRQVAVKKLQFNSCQAEDFKKEVEAIGQVRHKNLVRLIGYCIEGDYRMLVYEYVNNGNLHQWLHGRVGRVSPLTWGIRMNIIVGTAKGLAYLHEDIEPKVVHQAIKSSNILLDHKWNPKISDFGLASLFDPQDSSVTTRAIKTSSYIAPGYASTGVLTKKSDMYSFGILIMEIISGRTPIDYSKPQEEVYLIDWLKSMVANQKSDHVLDPKIQQRPTSKELKRVLLIALRCVDPDAKNRPKIGDVIHMLQPCDLLLSDRHCKRRETYHRSYPQGSEAVENIGEDAFDTNEGESSSNHPQKMMST